jgi:hypothetical protein
MIPPGPLGGGQPRVPAVVRDAGSAADQAPAPAGTSTNRVDAVRSNGYLNSFQRPLRMRHLEAHAVRWLQDLRRGRM